MNEEEENDTNTLKKKRYWFKPHYRKVKGRKSEVRVKGHYEKDQK